MINFRQPIFLLCALLTILWWATSLVAKAQTYIDLVGDCDANERLAIEAKLKRIKTEKGVVVTLIRRSTHEMKKVYRPAPFGYDADLVVAIPAYLSGDIGVLGTDAFSELNLSVIETSLAEAFRGQDVILGCYLVETSVDTISKYVSPDFANASVRAGVLADFGGRFVYPEADQMLIGSGLYRAFKSDYTDKFRPILQEYKRVGARYLRTSGWSSIVTYHRTSDAKVIALREGLFDVTRTIGTHKVSKVIYPKPGLDVVQIASATCVDDECLRYGTRYMLHQLRREDNLDELLDFALHVHGGSEVVNAINPILGLSGEGQLSATYNYAKTFVAETTRGVEFPILAAVGGGVTGSLARLSVNNVSVNECGYKATVASLEGMASAAVGAIVQSPINWSGTVNPDPDNTSINTDGFEDEYVPPSEMHETPYVTFGSIASKSEGYVASSGNYSLGRVAYVPTETLLGSPTWPEYRRGLFFNATGQNITVGFEPEINVASVGIDVMMGTAAPVVTSVSKCKAAIRRKANAGSDVLGSQNFGPYLIEFSGTPPPHARIVPDDNVTELTDLIGRLVGQTPLITKIEIVPSVLASGNVRTDEVRTVVAAQRAQLLRAGIRADVRERFVGEPGRSRISFAIARPQVLPRDQFDALEDRTTRNVAGNDSTVSLSVRLKQG